MSTDQRAAIRAWRAAHGRRLAVLDDDPTGSQSVHDMDVVTVTDAAEVASALAEASSAAFVLTNTRGMAEAAAVELTGAVAGNILSIDSTLDVVSRSDSTLRGHVLAEVTAIDAQLVARTGRHYDGVLLAPAFFEAGRFTEDDIHYATITGEPVPVGETEFARDATFGYAASNLREFVQEKSRGEIPADAVLSVSLETIRRGPRAVRDVLLEAHDLAFVIINARDYDDYEVVVLGVQQAIDAGRTFLFRSGPSFVRSLAGLEPRGPLTPADFPGLLGTTAHGLVVVGSHVSQTSRQVAVARESGGLIEFEVDVADLLRDKAGSHMTTVHAIRAALKTADVLIYTSRDLVTGDDADSSLAISLRVSAAVSAIVAGALEAGPAWVVAKGGITSHDVAVNGLGMRRARVLGQLIPGMISVFDPIVAAPRAVGIPYVVFAGNVGDDGTLAHVIGILHSAQQLAPEAAL